METGFLRTDDELRVALRTLQRFADLPETGLLDAETVRMMRRPRCGNADVLHPPTETRPERSGAAMASGDSDSEHRSDGFVPQEYILGPSKWHKKAITFRFVECVFFAEYKSVMHKGASNIAIQTF